MQTSAGDWITNRADGGDRLDVRLTLKTNDGRLQAVGVGERVGTTVKYDIYALK